MYRGRIRALLSVGLAFIGSGSLFAQTSSTGSNNFLGAIPHGELSPQPVSLTLQDAIDRGLTYNLGLLLSGRASDQARAARLEEFSQLLPQASASARQTRQVTSLQAFGLGFAPGIPATVGVTNTDLRASFSAPIIDLRTRSNVRAATASASAADWDVHDAREAVVLAVATTYLQTISADAALTAAQSDLASAQESYRAANARVQAGTSPELDGLRAQVEMQTRQQAVTQAQNVLDKQRIALLRIVGLPLRQQVVIVDRLAFKPLPDLGLDEAVRRALDTRADYHAAREDLRAAQLSQKAAQQGHLPILSASGDYGVLGTTPLNVLPTWSATALLKATIFDGGHIRSDVERTTAILGQRQAELDDLGVSIEQQVTDALLDVRAAAQQVQVATSSVDFARQALMDAQERFAAGFSGNLEVVQAQEALATANTQLVDALYAHNVAKLTIARAMGSAESDLKNILAVQPTATPVR